MDKKVFFYCSSRLHNAYNYMLGNAPEEIEYIKGEMLANPLQQAAHSAGKGLIADTIEKATPVISIVYNKLHLSLGIPKIRKFLTEEYDLVHSAQSLLHTKCPYVMDFEHPAVLAGYNEYAFDNPVFLKNLKRALLDKKLKKLLPWTNASRKTLLMLLPDKELEKKIETVYPVISPPPKQLQKRDSEKVKFLFIGGNFYEKGALEVLLAFEKIAEKYDTTLTIISAAFPDHLLHRYSKNPNIKARKWIPYQELIQEFSDADVFVYPTHLDTFSVVIMEAFSFGLPVITVKNFSTQEMVEQDKTGTILDTYYTPFGPDGRYIYKTNEVLYKERLKACQNPPEWYIDRISDAMAEMIENSKLRGECAKNAKLETIAGKFSPKRWKAQVKRIYLESME